MSPRRVRFLGPLTISVLVAGSLTLPSPADAARRPDLIVTSVARPPGFRQPGQAFTLKSKVKNVGQAKAAASVTRYFLSKNATKGRSDIALKGQAKVGKLRPNRKATDAAKLTIPSSTQTFVYFVIACADGKKELREKSESNNCKASPGRMLVDGAEDPANPLTVERTLDTGAVSEEIDGDAGGTLTTSASDGTGYSLEIPPGSLMETTEVTMTPLDSVSGSSASFDFDGGLAGGVEFEPHGLRLIKPAILSITPATPGGADLLPVGFAYSSTGEQFRLHPWKVEGSQVTMGLTHFSGGGIGYASSIDLSELPEFIPVTEHPEFRNEHSLGELLAKVAAGEITGEEFADLAAYIFIEDYYRNVVPALVKALNPNAAEMDAWDAFDRCNNWTRQVELLGLTDHEHSELKISLDTLARFCWKQYPKMAKIQFDQADERCSRVPPVNPAEQVRIMLRWARLSDLSLGGAFEVLGPDYTQKIFECNDKTPASVTGTVNYSWTSDQCIPDDSAGGCGTGHDEHEGTLNINFNKRSPDFCCDWDDAGGSYDASTLRDWDHVQEVAGEMCDVTSDAQASYGTPTGPGSTVTLDLTFAPTAEDVDAFVGFSDYVDDIQSVQDTRSGCSSPYDISYTEAAFFWSNDCPFRESGVPRTPGLMGTYDPNTKKIDMSCSDDLTEDGTTYHIEVTGTLTVTGGL